MKEEVSASSDNYIGVGHKKVNGKLGGTTTSTTSLDHFFKIIPLLTELLLEWTGITSIL